MEMYIVLENKSSSAFGISPKVRKDGALTRIRTN
jgi:hypothetical protein